MLVAALDDMPVMRQPIKPCCRHLCISTHARPFCKRQIRRDQLAGMLIRVFRPLNVGRCPWNGKSHGWPANLRAAAC